MDNFEEANKSQKEIISRRSFLDYLLGGSLLATFAGIALPVLYYLLPSKAAEGGGEAVAVGDESAVPKGKGKVFSYKEKAVIIINEEKTGLIALSAICTHLGCVVHYDEQKKQILCPCHAAVFDTKGNVVSGPAPKGLPAYKVAVAGGKIMISQWLMDWKITD